MLVSLERYVIINARIHDIRPIEIIKFFFALKSFLYHFINGPVPIKNKKMKTNGAKIVL